MEKKFPKPLKLFSEYTMGTKIPDLVLGEREIAIEIKYIREGASQTFEDLREDVYKVSEYVRENYVKHAFIAFVDELGSVRNRIIQLSPLFESWNEVKKKNKLITLGFVEITL